MTDLTAPSPPPTWSFVVCAGHGDEPLRRALEGLGRTAGGVAHEVLVCGSSGAPSWLDAHWRHVRWIDSGPGQSDSAQARQAGIEAALGELVAVLDDDVLVEPGWLDSLRQALGSSDSVAVACPLVLESVHANRILSAGGGMSWIGLAFEHEAGRPFRGAQAESAACEPVLFPPSVCMAVRRSAFLGVGGFDLRLSASQAQIDLGWRLWTAGKRVMLCRGSIVRREIPTSGESAFEAPLHERQAGGQIVRCLIKNYERKHALRALWKLHRAWLRERALGKALAAWRWNLPLLRDSWRARNSVRRRRRMGDEDLFAAGIVRRDCKAPPPRPARPACTSEWGSERWVESGVLLPGQDSALGRLGAGWFATEWWEGEAFRWACDGAQCFLRVAPRASGRLRVAARQAGKESGELRIACNGASATGSIDADSWSDVTLVVRADERGILAISLEVLRSRGTANPWWPASLGCAVREVWFEPQPADAPRAAAEPSISVVIPTYNRWSRLQETLAALETQSHPPAEVLVVDDGSSDGTWERLQALSQQRSLPFALRLHRQANAGPGAARNAGVARATASHVLFLGDDTIPDTDCVGRHLERHRELGGDCAVVGYTGWRRSSMRVTPFLELINDQGYQFFYGVLRDGKDTPFFCFYTSNISLPRHLMLEDPFDAAFPDAAWEDTEVGYRLALRGVRILYCPAARTQHDHPMRMVDFLRRQHRVGAGSAVIFDLQPALRQTHALLPGARTIRFYRRAGGPLRWLAPLASAIDQLGLRLPQKLYRGLLLESLCRGISMRADSSGLAKG